MKRELRSSEALDSCFDLVGSHQQCESIDPTGDRTRDFMGRTQAFYPLRHPAADWTLPSGSPVSSLGSQPWAAFPTGSGQLPGAPTLSVDRLLPGVMGPIPQAYNRSTPSVNHVSSVFPSSSIHSGNGTYSPHVPLGYTVHPTSDQVASNDRSFQNVALTQSYSMQNCCTIPQTSLPYGQSMPYLTSSLLPSLCNGFLNNIPQQMTTVPPHPQAALAAAAVAASNAARNCDPLRHFGPTLMNQLNRRPRPSVTSKTNLYISGLHETDSDETLRQIVESVVQPKSCKAMTVNGKCKGKIC
ncbi:unnamed protein product [Echinostoma caproni]|uniref:RRM domain-containing protein n=1 Tax=Echinostoma caproni TaxID=27848 RepID=A0A183BAA6_9TREM|nr:unnamed protein product [Echinostoma caproni]